MRRTPFSVGRRWLCHRPDSGRPDFHFMIVGPGDTPREKRCRVEWDPSVADQQRFQPFESTYSHRHLKKCATLVEDDDAQDA